ncbi:ABC transporter ATP-binding protein [Heyndrickxia oleronia]|jgi:ATP-binding cassette subfamily B protein|uniref:ABC transporter ATP-binding protein n=1 Tax=Heyndrickxia oleronia TaxID=38875 RepID=UPI000903DCBC|nr:ABC transporter ATP-binding protein [Heyndrickxia oleronia]NYV67182.1 ABC transporter ATP-binding protein [Bacillus sp. Gen3]OJH19001.1 multidrug ABC transporter ATP-binding protein [Bacillus obstructivus]MBU5210565.1 ABC transporter ATP-binding protein/permease [Heyndrickxia oleronia]MCI1591058.1 ABC transporter ATP-binding protein/permease [Heyndrickxia oleronia]MCI1613117.1 ABC transporter ATP-binding protein/permease [Heyndrickxia oleronia]
MDKQKTMTGKEQRKILIRLMSYTKPHMKMLIFAFFLLLLATIGDIYGPILVKVFIDDYLTPKEFPYQPLVNLALLYIFIQVFKVVVSYFQLYKFQEIAVKIIQQLRIDVFSKVHGLGMKYFDKTPAGSIVSRVTNDTEAINDMFVNVLVTFIQGFFLIIGIFIAMFALNVKLAIFCLCILPILVFIMGLYRKYSSAFYQDLRERLSQLNAKLSESLQGMSIIQVFRQEKRFRKEFSDINNKHYNAGMKNIKIDGLLLRPAIDLVYVFALIIVLSYFGISSFNHTIEIGVLYAFVNYLDRFFEPVNQMMFRLSMFQQAIVAASRVFRIIDEKEVAPHQESNQNLQIKNGEIEFRNVSFSYDGKRDVLKNISFKALPGQTIALVGHTGSGKSSTINLMMRFYEFERGEILIDGKSIKEYPIKELRTKLGLVLQDPFLFFGTIKDNIRLHNPNLEDGQIEDAAKFVQAHTFIERLQDRYDHKVVERGSTFSSGQRQLIAFARTMVTDPKILVLDEATANIDTETEEAIQEALADMRKGRTTIAIAHRLSTIQDADLILVLHQGEIVERGSHQELIALNGLYHKMYLLQNGLKEAIES